MYELNKPLPRQDDTLEYYRVNSPFEIASTKLVQQSLELTRTKESILSLKTFFKSKPVSIKTNGIQGLFKYDYTSSAIEAESEMNFQLSSVVKEKTYNGQADYSGPLNVEETAEFLSNNGFLSYLKLYTTIQRKSDFPLSNLATMDEVENKTIERTAGKIELVSPTSVDGSLLSGSIFNVGSMKSVFLTRADEVSMLTLSKDSISKLYSDNLSLVSPLMTDGYTPILPTDVITSDYAIENLWSVHGVQLTIGRLNGENGGEANAFKSLFIKTPLSDESPTNMSYLNVVGSKYVKKDSPSFGSIYATHSESLQDNSLLTVAEVNSRVGDYFSSLINTKVDTIDSFSTYMNGMCPSYSDYLGYDMSIDGGKVYVGFDYSNLNSILNMEAFVDLFFNKKGGYNENMPKIYQAANYFYGYDDILALAAYSQKLGFPFDIANDTIADVLEKLGSVMKMLCLMPPSVVPTDDDPVIPTFKAEAFIAPPTVLSSSFFPNSARAFLQKPTYIEPSKFVMITPPELGSFYPAIATSFLNKPVYFPATADITTAIPPVLGTFHPLSSASYSLSKPSYSVRSGFTTFSKLDQDSPYMTIFASSDECDNRFVMKSSRQVNMMEVGVVAKTLLSNVLTSQYYFSSQSEDYVIMKSQMLTLMLGDIMCAVYPNIKMRMSVNLDDVLHISSSSNSNRGNGEDKEDCLSGSSEIKTLPISEWSDRVSAKINGVSVGVDGEVFGDYVLDKTEIIGEFDFDEQIVSWDNRYGSEEYVSVVHAVSDQLVSKINSYSKGKIYSTSTPIEAEDVLVSSLDNIEEGYFLVDYLSGVISSGGGSKKIQSADVLGVFSDKFNLEKTQLSEYALPYSNVVVGSHGEKPTEDRRENPPSPKPGNTKIQLWRPLFSTNDSSLKSLQYLSISSASEAIFSLYGPLVLIYRDDNHVYYDDIGVEVEVAIEKIAEENYHVLKALDSRVVLQKTSVSSAPTHRKFTRDYCDDWVSQLSTFGNVSLDSPTISPLISQGGVSRTGGVIVNVPSSIEADGGCNKPKEKLTYKSGISPSIVENISDLTSLDPNAPEQKEGEVPGAYSVSFIMKATKYSPEATSSGGIDNVVNSTNFNLCVVLGVIDGLVDDGGDILAQGYTQDNLPTGELEPIVYIGPNPVIKEYLSLERIAIGDFDVSKFTIRVADIVKDKLIDASTGKKFVEFLDILTDSYVEADVELSSSVSNQEELTPYRTVLVGDIRSPGATFSYKHAGQDPAYPIIMGYAGSTEVDFVGGSRLVGTLPTPIPLTTYTESDSSDSFIPNVDLTTNSIHFLVNNKTIDVLIRDTKAVFSENRTIKTLMETE